MTYPLFSINDCARLLGIPESRISYAHRNGQLPDSEYFVAGKRIYTYSDLQRIAEFFEIEPPSESEAPRYDTAEMPKKAPDAMPISAVRSLRLRSRLLARMSVVATEIAITPTRLTRIATLAPRPIGSPRITIPKSAVCTVSVLE